MYNVCAYSLLWCFFVCWLDHVIGTIHVYQIKGWFKKKCIKALW
jgi:hypothetical protein